MTDTAPATVRTHRWELAGLGRAPFTYLGMHEQRHDMGGGYSKPGGTCDYCGQGILYCFRVQSSDGKKFVVGCDCIAHCHDPAEKIVVQAKRALKEYKRAKAGEGRAAKRKAEAEARQARWAAEREANAARLATDPLYLRIKAVVGVATRDGANGFLVDMRDSMEKWGRLTEAQEAATVRVLDRIEQAPALKAASRWLGEVGERVTITATVEFSRCIYHGQWSGDPDRYLNKLRTDDGAVVTWFGARPLTVGDKLTGTARVGKCETYQNEKQTVIKNPRWKA